MKLVRLSVCAIVCLGLFATSNAQAQTAYPRPPGANPTNPTPAQQPASTNPAPTQTPQQDTPTPAATSAPAQQAAPVAAPPTKAEPAAAKKAVKVEKEKKSKKEEYTGPKDIVTKPASPMLDASGKPELDPDGKPLMNAPVKQLRDKKGHPVFDADGKPQFQTASDLGYDDHGKKLKAEKVKPPKMVPVHITRGTFTVDGVTGKAALNYDIPDMKYMYFYVPGTGVVIVSNSMFPGAKEYKNAFNDKMLDVTVSDHKLELASDSTLLGKKPESAFVKIDRDYTVASRFPVVGYGTLRVAPYAWPGAKPNAELAGTVVAPPLPKNLQPKLAILPCPKGQVRATLPPARDGEVQPTPPCMTPTVVKPVTGLNSAGAK